MKLISNYLKKIASGIQYKINWVKPDISSELGEYFENEVTKKFLHKNGIVFNTEKELLSALETGKLTPITKDQLKGGINFTLTPEELKEEFSDPVYRKNYMIMKNLIEKKGTISLPAPIVLNVNGELYGFAGNRRINLSFEYNLPLKVWLVNLRSNH